MSLHKGEFHEILKVCCIQPMEAAYHQVTRSSEGQLSGAVAELASEHIQFLGFLSS
jgi:hypothetical protein